VGRPRPLQAALHRAERLGRAVAAARPELVLCHADLHLANLLVDAEGRLWVVDWDGLQLTPRERDLLFATGPQRARFLEGYGPVTLDRPTVAYYRWEWVVQELADLRWSRPRRPARGRHQAARPGGAPAAVRAR
jgi:spectinomycin phosphotransferase